MEPFSDVSALADLLASRRTVVLSGAGISTESGIPDYRGPETHRRSKNPIQYRQFIDDPPTRQRYWSRSLVGYPRIARAKPNAGHRALARLEQAGLAAGVITQNVDRLHQAAGSQRVVELHGTLGEVRCLACEAVEARAAFQQRLLALNPDWSATPAALNPDGDAELPDAAARGFNVAACRHCGGALKPDVVFFGERVPRAKVDAAWQLFDEADALLVVGSSLAVYSGYRFVLRAAKEGRPVAIVNLGPTRGDDRAQVRIQGQLGTVLPALAHALVSITSEAR